MLLFVGTGIDGVRGLSLAAIDELDRCDVVYAERFTSSLSERDIDELAKIIKKPVSVVSRWYIEDGREILENAASRSVALVTYGDPLIATTHAELRTRAVKKSIKTKVMHSASGIFAAIGEIGLQFYKFGRAATIMSDFQSARSVYNAIYENLLNGNHSLVLTEFRGDGQGDPFFLDPPSAIRSLVEIENDRRLGIILPETFGIVASRVGTASQAILSGALSSLQTRDCGQGPHSIIIPGALHFVEQESIEACTELLDPVTDNSQRLKTMSAVMLEKYAPRARDALKQLKDLLLKESSEKRPEWKEIFDVLDNAEYYILDGERFMRQRQPELAVLSIGYSEGLIDALRFLKGMNPWESRT